MGFADGEFPMKAQKTFTYGMTAALAFALCGVPEALQAQQTSQAPAGQQPQQQAPGNRGVIVDPSQGPLTPPASTEQQQPATPTTVPESPSPSTTIMEVPQSQQSQEHQPLGAAAAGGVATAGGGASRPAGTAIAPERQHQVRSFLIKLGAVAAAGVAIGTVYALSRGTSSTPPNSGR